MNFCPNCGSKVNVEDKFCLNCGFNIQKRVQEMKNAKQEVSQKDSFTINEPNNEASVVNNIPLEEDDEDDEDQELSYNPLKNQLDEKIYGLYNTLLSIFKLDYVNNSDMSIKLIKVSEKLEGKIDEEDEIELDNFVQSLCDKNHFATQNDIDDIDKIVSKYEKEYGNESNLYKPLPIINKKINNQLKTQLTVLSRVLISIFSLNINEKKLENVYKEIISQLKGRIREEEINKLEDSVLPLFEKGHAATPDEVYMIQNMVNEYDDSYNKNHTEKVSNDSQLKGTLNYLSGQSSSAIADAESLSDLQEYMYVKRGSLEDDLLSSLKDLNIVHGKLIFLVGNVGDGKSYSIGHLKKQYPSLFSDNMVHIYYDATESFDPKKTAMETLLEELNRFSDENIEENYENWIIAINMGVLINFIRKARENGKFTKLIKYLESTGITERTSNVKNIKDDYFNMIAFRNYPLFNIDETGITSDFYDELFNKVVEKSTDNPFYSAYLNDLNNNSLELVHHNFELFSQESVRKTLKFLLIKIQIESKVIISTRSLLELIHDILVPTEIEGKELSYKESLPYLLFGGVGDSTIIKKISVFDPMTIQNESVEELMTKVYNSHKNLEELAEKFIGIDDAKNLDWLWRYTDQVDTPFSEKVALLLRIKYLLDKSNDIFDDTYYYQYLKLLHALETEGRRSIEVKNFYKKIQNFIYLWCGSPRESYVFTFINDEKKFGVAVPFDLSFDEVKESNFNIIFTLENLDRGKQFNLVIDYELFVLINEVNSGYLLKSSDKHQFVNVSTFIENIIKSHKSNKETLIGNIETNKYYRLTNDGMGIDLREIG